MNTRFGRLALACLVIAGLITVGATRAAADEITDADDLMMLLMGGGVEDASGGFSISRLGVLATGSPGAFRAIDVQGAVAARAFGVNAVGEIVGSYTDATGTYGFLWKDGDVTKIVVTGAISTEAWGINPQGDIVGRYRLPGDPRTLGFLLRDGVFTDISVAGHLHTLPIKITPSRDIVGCFHDMNFLRDMRGYVQRGDQVRSFELLPSSMHNGVTPGGGTIAGISFDSPTQVHSYVLDRGVYTQFDFPGATFTEAWDVSPNGKVVGYFNQVDSHGFALDADGLTQIDVPGARWTRIFGINPQGDMVGSYADAANQVHAFLLRGRDQS